MKKTLSVFLIVLFVFTLCDCAGDVNRSEDTGSQTEKFSSMSDSQTTASDFVAENSKKPGKTSSQQSSSKPQITSDVNISSENSVAENESTGNSSSDYVTTPENNTFDTPIDPEDKYLLKNNHSPLDKEKYYQYSFLNDVEKEVYRRLRVATLSYDRVIEVSDIDISNSRKNEIIECFMADNPQYFWITETYAITRKGDIELYFSDGEIEDNNGFGNADSSKIDARRKMFNQAVFDIVSSINPNASEYEKELAIHDYITKTTKYDKKAQLNPFANGVMDSAYNAYGVIVEKSGVCTGYSNAFQYLCYMVGINSNVVFGNAHVWNTVQIEGEWYQVDVTWDDPIKSDGSSGDGNHNYFNLTSANMYKTHALSTESIYRCIKVPNCTATKNTYH